jgi:predicted CopG family antitoxin
LVKLGLSQEKAPEITSQPPGKCECPASSSRRARPQPGSFSVLPPGLAASSHLTSSLTPGAQLPRLLGDQRRKTMATATVRIPAEKRDILRIIASIEKTEMKEILSELIDEYIERHRETLDLLSRPEWVEAIRRGKEEVRTGVRGKSLEDLAD